MFKNTKAFSGFSVNDITLAKKFYGEVLGLFVTEENGLLTLHIEGGTKILVYSKPDHVPGTFTILNFPVRDIENTVKLMAKKGIKFEAFEGTDQLGINHNQGPLIAWFKDPAGNFLSVIEDDMVFTGDTAHVTTFIPIESEEVFKYWSDPSLLEKWFSPRGVKLLVEQFNFYVGGSFLFKYISEKEIFMAEGQFKKITPKENIVYTVYVNGPDGNRLLDTLVTVEFEELEWGTEIVVAQTGFTDSKSIKECELGWGEDLIKLKNLLIEHTQSAKPADSSLSH